MMDTEGRFATWAEREPDLLRNPQDRKYVPPVSYALDAAQHAAVAYGLPSEVRCPLDDRPLTFDERMLASFDAKHAKGAPIVITSVGFIRNGKVTFVTFDDEGNPQ